MKVDFVTLGGAAKELDVPAPTLRGWADRLEELNIHYLERNHRDERIFYESDIEIFRFMKEAKDKYGRKTTTIDLAYVILEKDDVFELRKKGEVPEVPKHKAQLSELDLEHVLSHPTFQAFMQEVIKETTSSLSDEIAKEVSNKLNKEMQTKLEEIEEIRIKNLDKLFAEQKKTQQMMKDYLNMPFYKRLFIKNPFKD